MRIAIAGTGYVGLVTGVCLAAAGHSVICVDPDALRIDILKSGESPLYEKDVGEMMRTYRRNLEFTSDYKSAYERASVLIICVGTPQKPDGSTDLTDVFAVAAQIAENVRGRCVVAVKSTVPVGTNDTLEAYIRAHLRHDAAVDVVSNPEFLSQGTAVQDTLHGGRIVIGAESAMAAEMLRSLYESFEIPFVMTGRRSAELMKYACNSFLALKISYINEIANLCEMTGADIDDVTRGMCYDTRIGSRFLKAGVGYGGSCFPKDTRALHLYSDSLNFELKTIKAAIQVNEAQKNILIKKARKYFAGLSGLTAAVLGLSYKPGTDDLRESPAVANILTLLGNGVSVRAWDPIARPNYHKKGYPEINFRDTLEEALSGADFCLIFTEWPQILEFDLNQYPRLMKTPIVIDGRNCYRLLDARRAGIIYESVGRAAVEMQSAYNGQCAEGK